MQSLLGIARGTELVYDYSEATAEHVRRLLEVSPWFVKYVFKNAWARLLDSQTYILVKSQPDFSMSHPRTSPWIFSQPVTYLRGPRKSPDDIHARIAYATSNIMSHARELKFTLVGKLLTACMFVSPLEETFVNIRWQTHRYDGSDVTMTPTAFSRYLEYFYPGWLSIPDTTHEQAFRDDTRTCNIVPIELEYGDEKFDDAVNALAEILHARIVSRNPVVLRAPHIRSDVRVRVRGEKKAPCVYDGEVRVLPAHYLDVMSGIWESNELLPDDFGMHCTIHNGIFDRYRTGYRQFRRLYNRDDRRVVYRDTRDVPVVSTDQLIKDITEA